MKELTDAIVTKYGATAGLVTALPGGLWASRVASGTARPYAVFNVINAPTVLAYGTGAPYDAEIQFTAVANGPEAAMTAMKALTDVYDDTALTLTGRTNIGVRRDDEPYPILQPGDETVKDENAADVWACHVTYTYFVQ